MKVWDVRTGRELLSLNGHTAGVWNATFSQDGGRLASASRDKTVRVWDAHTGAVVLILRGHTERVTSVAF